MQRKFEIKQDSLEQLIEENYHELLNIESLSDGSGNTMANMAFINNISSKEKCTELANRMKKLGFNASPKFDRRTNNHNIEIHETEDQSLATLIPLVEERNLAVKKTLSVCGFFKPKAIQLISEYDGISLVKKETYSVLFM